MGFLARSKKAIGAGIGAGLAAFATAEAKGHVGSTDWALIVGSAIVTGVITYFTPKNADPANQAKADGTTVTNP